jgi:hypothetical protein
MPDQYQNKYRIASVRAQWWDYGRAGAYFVTICGKDREHFFGEIKNGKMILSAVGVIADILWYGHFGLALPMIFCDGFIFPGMQTSCQDDQIRFWRDNQGRDNK